MAPAPRLWMRAEVRAAEHRAPIAPADARRLVGRGIPVTVEESSHRIFPDAAYAAAGCRLVPPHTWPDADPDQFIVGLKELPAGPADLVHRHIYFGHAYKGQPGSGELLRRFVAGGGALLDIEYLTDGDGRRLAAFGYWAGYAGAALAVLHWRGQLATPLLPTTRRDLDRALSRHDGDQPAVLVVGALGRCGSGARAALAAAGITPTCWDLAETRVLDRPALLGHDILVNTVLATRPVPPFLLPEHLADPRRLALVADVTCDVGSACNVLPIYDQVTSWDRPVRRLRDGTARLDLIALDNLPSLLPEEASVAFSAELTPHLMSLGQGAPPWTRCLDTFRAACRAAGPAAVPAGPAAAAGREPADG